VLLENLVQTDKLISIDSTESTEQAFLKLTSHNLTSIPIRDVKTKQIKETFDYSDLIAYLLLVLRKIEPVDQSQETLDTIANARSGNPVPVTFSAEKLGVKNQFHKLKSSATILDAVDILSNGVHRIAITDVSNDNEVIGVLSQRRLIRYIWENGRLFKSLEPLFHQSLQELGLASNRNIISISGDETVLAAFQKMHDDGVSSLAVTDESNNLLGNISIVDVKLVSKGSQKSLLKQTCKHFLNIILNQRGLDDGKDSFPVFHVIPQNTLGRTIAKLVATQAHRLWVVQPNTLNSVASSASSSGAGFPLNAAAGNGTAGSGLDSTANTTAGQLSGVVSLTDILCTLAKYAGKQHLDPQSARRERRRSSSSSVRSQSSSDRFRRSLRQP
jgi:CBS domain-containing protein